MYQPCALDGCRLAPGFKRDGRLSHELVIMTTDGDRNLQIFQGLYDQRERIEGLYGRPLIWDRCPGVKRCLIGEYRPGSIEQSTYHVQYIDWFLDCGDRLRRAILNTR
jgi:hypothetical protein